jgi:Winged helix DNA-binding domain
VIAERLTAQLLAGPPARAPAAVAERLLAIQAQDPRGARLAIRARTTGLSVADVERSLTEERSLVVGWLNRGTLHMVRREDYWWLHSLTTPPLFTGNARRLEQEGVSPRAADRAVRVIERSLAEEGPLTRLELRDRIAEAGLRTEGQALVHQLMLACLRGVAVRGPMSGREHAYALARDWLPVPAVRLDRERLLAELGRRYLAAHGPAGERDLAKWAGLPLRDARAALGAIAPELDQRADGLVDLAGRAPAAELPRPRLLGAFEPLLLGWVSRSSVLGEHEPRVVSGGLFRPILLAGGRAVGTWRVTGGEVVVEPFERLARALSAAVAEEARGVLEYLAPPTPLLGSIQ